MPELRSGEERSVPGSSGRSYIIKRVGDVYSCSCPAWRNQHEHPNARTCKHLRRFRGSDLEDMRLRQAAAAGYPVNLPSRPIRQPAPQPYSRPTPARRADVNYPSRAPAPAPRPRPAPPAPPPPPKNMWDRLAAWDEVFDGPKPPEPPPAPVAVATEPETAKTFAVLLAETWDGAQNPTGYLMSEKLDGVRAYWDGEKFISRLGNVFAVPEWYKAEMPKGIALDGEFWMGRGRFQETSGFVRRHGEDAAWHNVSYQIFDAPDMPGGFEARLKVLQAMRLPAWAQVLTQRVCTGLDDLRAYLLNIEKLGGEGVMLRKPGSLYVRFRSDTLLKVKSFYDAEATVVGHTAGKGKHKGRTGALECMVDKPTSFTTPKGVVMIPVGTKFKVGTGLSDAQRLIPPRYGSTITFRFQELTKDGVPRFPSYVGERNYE